MGLRNFFHGLKTGISRIFAPSIPNSTMAKRFGDIGEDRFAEALQQRLPDCRIKKNVIIQTEDGNAEIDCIVLYNDKLFAIEVKHWKGCIVERDEEFFQYKDDRWTDDIHTKRHRSPFKQLGRAIHLIRNQIGHRVWLNDIVFFEDSDSDDIKGDKVWFKNIDLLVSYIVNEGKVSYTDNAKAFFDDCIAADRLYNNAWDRSLHCIVRKESLHFRAPDGIITLKHIRSIAVKHHWSYDELDIETIRGSRFKSKAENASIFVVDNGIKQKYSLSKIDYIQFGN